MFEQVINAVVLRLCGHLAHWGLIGKNGHPTALGKAHYGWLQSEGSGRERENHEEL